MPKAAMHKNHLTAAGKYEVGLSGEVFAVDAEAVALAMQQGTKQYFGLCVLASDPAHVFAAALRIENGMIVEARLAAGGVAHRPWRLRHSEAALVGAPPTSESFAAAGAHAMADATPLAQNAFKIPLLRNAVARALETVGGAT